MSRVLLACWDAVQRLRLGKTCRAARAVYEPCEKWQSHVATHQALMNRRSLAWVEWTHVNKNEILGKFPKREFSAILILTKGDASLQQGTE
jgi:hypothetical protein